MVVYKGATLAIKLNEVSRIMKEWEMINGRKMKAKRKMMKKQITAELTIENPQYSWMTRKKGYYQIKENGSGVKYLTLPRGFLPRLQQLCENYEVEWSIKDRTITCPSVTFESQIELRDYQVPAVEAALQVDEGVLIAPHGSGNTIMGLEIVARRRQPTLWLVHTKDLLHQAIEDAALFLQIPKDEIGVFGDRKRKIGDRLTIGLVDTLTEDIPDDELLSSVGIVILYEANHCPIESFTEVVSKFPAKFRLGLATPFWKYGSTKPMNWILGDVAHEIDIATLIKSEHFIKPKVKEIEAESQYAKRNGTIISYIASEVEDGRFCLILSEGLAHCDVLSEMLKARLPDITAEVLGDKVANRQRQQIVERIRDKQVQVVFTTNKLAEEWLGLPHLDRLFLARPGNEFQLQQAIGQIIQPAEGKNDAIIYEFVDIGAPRNRNGMRTYGGLFLESDYIPLQSELPFMANYPSWRRGVTIGY